MRVSRQVMLFALASLLSFACGYTWSAEGVNGHLVIIGDGAEDTSMLERFVALAGGPKRARILVVPMASSIPDTVGMRQVKLLKSMGVRQAQHIIFSRQQALQRGFADTLSGATGIFFTGGDQSRLAAVLVGTPVQEKLLELYRNGAVIGGGSAGAAIMSKIMITGDELLRKDSATSFVSIQKGNIKTSEGLGFLDDAIIDQHFVQRKRHNRLISVVLEHPSLVGIGIDEQTAILVYPDRTCEVIGKRCVVVYDARKATAIRSTGNASIGGVGLTVHVLLQGDRYNITTGAVQPSAGAR